MNGFNWLLDLMFPPKCPFCGTILEKPRDPACPQCQKLLPWLTGERARRDVDFTAGCWSPLAYQDRVVQGVRRYKFPGNPAYARPLGVLVAQCVQDSGEKADLVTWAPLSRQRRWRRGFDQGEKLARVVAAELGLPVRGMLRKVRHTQPQSGLEDPAARRANALGAYAPAPGVQGKGLRILLVDDVVTSGATLSECARVLLGAGAGEVLCATLAQARKK